MAIVAELVTAVSGMAIVAELVTAVSDMALLAVSVNWLCYLSLATSVNWLCYVSLTVSVNQCCQLAGLLVNCCQHLCLSLCEFHWPIHVNFTTDCLL